MKLIQSLVLGSLSLFFFQNSLQAQSYEEFTPNPSRSNYSECEINRICKNPQSCSLFSKFSGAAYISQTQGDYLGGTKGYTTIGDFFIYPNSHHDYFVADIRVHYYDHQQIAANAGIGKRIILQNLKSVIGVALFYDYWQNALRKYHEIGLSAEATFENFDLRINSYFPYSKTLYHSPKFQPTPDDPVFCRHFFYAPRGLDIEIGAYLNQLLFCSKAKLYFALGPYYYRGKESPDAIRGIRGRLIYQPFDYLGFELRGAYDNNFGKQLQGTVTLVFPFGKLPSSNSHASTESFIKRRFIRNAIIIKQSYIKCDVK